jgi:3-isopropylmalate/(R)-2-methylmalate dehydratase small subunit
LIAPSFADIFYNNCFKNGLLPIRLDEAVVDDLFARAAAHQGYALTVDLGRLAIADGFGLMVSFEVDPFRRQCLLDGLDDVALTLKQEAAITAYEKAHAAG